MKTPFREADSGYASQEIPVIYAVYIFITLSTTSVSKSRREPVQSSLHTLFLSDPV
jgi:hypothetical protein